MYECMHICICLNVYILLAWQFITKKTSQYKTTQEQKRLATHWSYINALPLTKRLKLYRDYAFLKIDRLVTINNIIR